MPAPTPTAIKLPKLPIHLGFLNHAIRRSVAAFDAGERKVATKPSTTEPISPVWLLLALSMLMWAPPFNPGYFGAGAVVCFCGLWLVRRSQLQVSRYKSELLQPIAQTQMAEAMLDAVRQSRHAEQYVRAALLRVGELRVVDFIEAARIAECDIKELAERVQSVRNMDATAGLFRFIHGNDSEES